MRERRRRWLVAALAAVVVLLLAVSTGWAIERFPPPTFTTDYQLPHTNVPQPSCRVTNPVAVVTLVVALALASFFAVKMRSRRGLFVLAILSLAWFGFWREGCVCAIGSIQNITTALFDASYAIPWTIVAFFALPLIFTLFFGRTFCAAVCPLGAVQELFTLRPIKVPAWLEGALGLLAYVYLGLAVLFAATGAAFVICRYDPFVAFFRLSGSWNMLTVGACFLAIGVFVGRPYCRFLCPYGALLRLTSKVSQWHVKIPPKECIQCRLCEDACPYGAIRAPMVEQKAEDRARGRARLALAIALLPLLLLLGAGVGRLLAGPMSQWHPAIRLAEQVFREEVAKRDRKCREIVDRIQALQQEGDEAETAGREDDVQRISKEIEGLERRLAKLKGDEQILEAEIEELESILVTTDASDAFRNTGKPLDKLYEEALTKRKGFLIGGVLFGIWVGLVIGVKLIHLQVRRRRTDYVPDRGSCVSCGRCFRYCPSELERRGLIQDMTEPAKQAAGEKT